VEPDGSCTSERHADPPLGVPEVIEPSWLTSVLRQSRVIDKARVRSTVGESIGTGQVAENRRYRLDYDVDVPGAPRSLILKEASEDPTSRSTAMLMGLYRREVLFYRLLAPRLRIRIPACYHAAIDEPSGRFILVLEDLPPTAHVDQLTGFSADHAMLALEQAAALHAPLWGSKWLGTLSWLAGQQGRTADNVMILPKLMTEFVKRYADTAPPRVLELCERVAPGAAAFALRQPKPWTAQHGDFRPDNMLFGARNGEVPLAVVDWQTVGLGPGMVDVAFVLGTSLDIDARRAHEVDLVRGYHQALCAGGVEGYDWDRCWRDYRRYAYYALTFLAPSAVLVKRTERGDRMFLTALDRAVAQIADLSAEELLPS
jgi:hypothetical protein